MALFIGNTLAKGGIFNTADTEAAFHPWWKTVQDYVCYSAILIGKLFGFCVWRIHILDMMR